MRLPVFSLVIALSAASAAPLAAQTDMSGIQITTQQIKPGVAVLFGAGGNIGVSYGPDGTILIDDQFVEAIWGSLEVHGH